MAAPGSSNAAADKLDFTTQCDDFSFFQDKMRNLRTKDDRITNALNTTIPTLSFAGKINASDKCKSLYGELLQGNSQRVSMIKTCLEAVSEKVEIRRKARQADMDDIEALKALRKEQTKLRQLQSEMNVEEIVMDQSMKVFYERCRQHYLPPPRQ